jgi:hydrogenase nickel incorporation protein HypA/HybF
MHEFSICEGLVEAVLKEMGKLDPPPDRLVRIRVVMGRLHQIVPDYLDQAFEVLARGTAAEGAEMNMEMLPVVGRCNACQWEGEVEPPFFRCGRCEALDLDVVKGKELYLDRMEVEYDDG